MTEFDDTSDLPQDPQALQRLVQELSRKQARDIKYSASPEYKDALRQRFQKLGLKNVFTIGQLVRWKPGLANKMLPDVESVGIVVEIRDDPMFAPDRDPASPYYMEPLDLAIGVISGDDRAFVVYWFDSRRFEPVPEGAE